MDNEPFIIKSGKGHSVEIEQGSSHAKSRRNVVASQEDDLEDRMVSEGLREERKQLDLTQQVEAKNTGDAADDLVREDPQGVAAKSMQKPESEPGQAAAASVQQAEAVGQSSGVVLQHEVKADQDAKAVKARPQEDRSLGVQEEVPSEELAREPQAPQQQSNRQKIEQLQSAANRIQVSEPDGAKPGQLDIGSHAHEQPALVSNDASSLRTLPATSLEAAPATLVSGPTQELPPELQGNLGFRPAAQESTESAFLARVRALRSNMSVTDSRLSKLQGKPPAKS